MALNLKYTGNCRLDLKVDKSLQLVALNIMAIKYPYLRKTWNLAAKSLPDNAWPDFRQHYADFPAEGRALKKLGALRRNLHNDLLPKDSRANQNLRHEHMRADLNKYHGWLTHKILQKALDESKLAKSGAGLPFNRIIFPEDLPKVIEDLYRFHKHSAAIAARTGNPATGTIQHYKSLEQLRDAVDPYRPPPSPLTSEDRTKAFYSHLAEYGGDGGAEIIATLQNGTRIIQLHSEKASIAFGSPHWCTAYRDKKTSFNTYKNDLLILLDPDGRRYQIHFHSLQFMDANDNAVPLKDLMNARPGLHKALTPYISKTLTDDIALVTLQGLLPFCEGNEELEQRIKADRLIQKALYGHLENVKRGSENTEYYLSPFFKNPLFLRILSEPGEIGSLLTICAEKGMGHYCNAFISHAAGNHTLEAEMNSPLGIAQAMSRATDRFCDGDLDEYYFRQTLDKILAPCKLFFTDTIIRENALPSVIDKVTKKGYQDMALILNEECESFKEFSALKAEDLKADNKKPALAENAWLPHP